MRLYPAAFMPVLVDIALVGVTVSYPAAFMPVLVDIALVGVAVPLDAVQKGSSASVHSHQ
jgi:hypothetical protein